MSVFSPNIGVDLGTSSVVFYVAGRGIALREPSLVVIRNNASRDVVAIGEEAFELQGRMPEDLIAVHPILQGVIADFELTVLMLKYFLRHAIGVNRLGKPRAVVSIPGEITEMERRAVEEAFRMAGFRSVYLVESIIAAAHGSGLSVYDPQGSLVVDIGGGTSEAAVLSMGGIVSGKSERGAGMAWDEIVTAYVKKKFSLMIGSRTAEDIKMDLGSAVKPTELKRAMVRGRDVATGLPQVVEISSEHVYEALSESADKLVKLLVYTLERTPPELGADVMRTGIYLTGGLSQLPGVDRLLATELGIPTQLARNPTDCVALGCGYLATNLDLLSRIGRNHPLTE